MEPGTDYLKGYWGPPADLAMDAQPNTSSPSVIRQQLDVANNGNVYLNWTQSSNTVAETLKIMRATADASGAYTWSDPNSSRFTPVGIAADASGTQFTVNKSNADGYAHWGAGGSLKISEFMASMGHFMGSANLADGHAPQILADASGNAYLVSQDHMTGGFSLEVVARSAWNTWGSTAALHRMGMTTEITLPNHLLESIIDGQGNIRSIWLEKEMSTLRLMTATYTASAKTWGTPVTMIDSSNTDGVDLAALQSIGATGEPSSENLRVVLFQDTGGEKAVFTVDFTGNAARMPVRRDASTATRTIEGVVSYGVGGDGYLLAAWVELSSGLRAIRALSFSPAGGWVVATQVAVAPMEATVDGVTLALNRHGHAAVLWIETDTKGRRFMSSVRISTTAWATKELVANFAVDAMLQAPAAVMLDDGTPWIVLTEHGMGATSTTLTTRLVKRLANVLISGVPAGQEPGESDDGGGHVQVAWLESSAASLDAYDMKLATYAPMVGWSATTNGPAGLVSASAINASAGEHRIIVVTDVVTGKVDAYLLKHSGGWSKFANINQKTTTDGTRILRAKDTRVVAGGTDNVMVAWRESVTAGSVTEVRYRTVAAHHTTDSAGADAWHWDAPSQVGGLNAESESELNYLIDNMGTAHAVWTSIDGVNNTSNVYANIAAMGAAWKTTPELLAGYDMSTGSYALRSSIVVNSLGKVAIAWDQHLPSTTMATHRVWLVENE